MLPIIYVIMIYLLPAMTRIPMLILQKKCHNNINSVEFLMKINTILHFALQYVNDLYEGSKEGEDIDLDTYLNSISETTKTTDKR